MERRKKQDFYADIGFVKQAAIKKRDGLLGGQDIAARVVMIAIKTRSSIKVKAVQEWYLPPPLD